MKRIKRIVSIIIAVSFALSLTACGRYVRHKTNSSDVSSSTQSISSTPTASQPSHNHDFDPYTGITDEMKGTTVRFATWEDYYTKINYMGDHAMETIYDDIGLHAEYVSIPESGYVDKIKTKIASGDAPDVFKSAHKNSFPLTLDIAAPINKVSTVNLNDPIWEQSLINTATLDGDVYLLSAIGSPWNESVVLYYNKPIFEENGIKTPSEHYEDGTWTWENFEKCIRDIKAIDPEIQGAYIERDDFLNSQGFALLQYSNTFHSFSNGATNNFYKVYREYMRLKEDGLLDGTSLSSVSKGECAMAAAKIAAMRFAPIVPPTQNDDIGFTYLPSAKEGETSRIISEHIMYGIVDGAKNADAAGYFIRYWLDPENYDLTNHFDSLEEGNFYYEATTVTADKKFFNFDDAGAVLIGKESREGLWSSYTHPVGTTAPANALDTVVNSAKDQANKKINDRRYKTMTDYENRDFESYQ